MIIVHMAVNNEHGDVTQECHGIDIELPNDHRMQIECALSFDEIPDNIIQVDNRVFSYQRRGTMVGNAFWNAYSMEDQEGIDLINYLVTYTLADLVEASVPLFEKWELASKFTLEDLSQ